MQPRSDSYPTITIGRVVCSRARGTRREARDKAHHHRNLRDFATPRDTIGDMPSRDDEGHELRAPSAVMRSVSRRETYLSFPLSFCPFLGSFHLPLSEFLGEIVAVTIKQRYNLAALPLITTNVFTLLRATTRRTSFRFPCHGNWITFVAMPD